MINQEDLSKALQRQVGGDHYKHMAIDPMTYCILNDVPYFEGNIIKYVTRWRKKDGVQDLKKALHYLEVLIAHEEAKQPAKQPKSMPWSMQPADMGPDDQYRSNTPEDGGHHAKEQDVD